MKMLLMDEYPRSQWENTIKGKESMLQLFMNFSEPEMKNFVTRVDAIHSLLPAVRVGEWTDL